LLVEDLVAIVVLMLISVGSSALGAGFQNSLPILALIVKALALFLLTFGLSKFILNKVFEYTAKSVELLFITSIAWCFAFTSLAVALGFSVEIGAFLAGVALASSPYHLQIQVKIKPLRDFCLALFFIHLGSSADFKEIGTALPIILVFTIYALTIKPIIYMSLLSRFGFKKHTLFQTALNLSQVSEFSLIVLMVGVNSSIVDPITVSIMAVVAVLSITVSSILISQTNNLYKALAPFAGLLELKSKSHYFERKAKKSLTGHIIVIGGHRVGGPIVDYLFEHEIPFVVMDFNPTIVRELSERGVNAIYGDIGDPEITEALQLESAKLVICTATDLSDNEVLLNLVKATNKNATIILRAADSEHAKILKMLGADYVLLPEKVSGDYIVQQIQNHWPDLKFKETKAQKIKSISSIV
jgi:hypothetical protein